MSGQGRADQSGRRGGHLNVRAVFGTHEWQGVPLPPPSWDADIKEGSIHAGVLSHKHKVRSTYGGVFF